MAVIRRSSPLPTPRSFEEVRARFSQPLNSDWDEGVNPSENWPTGIRSALSSSLMTGGLVPSFPMGDTQEPSFVAPTGQPTYIEPFKPPSEEQMEAMGQPERIAANVLPLALDLPFFAGMGTLAAPLGPLGAGAATLGAYSGLQAAKRQLPPGEIATEVGKGMLLGGLTAGVGKLINTPVAQRAFQNAIKAGLPVEAARQAARAAVENPAVAIPRWFAQWGGVFGGLGPSIEAGEPTMPTPESIFGSLATGAAMHAPGIARGAARGARAAGERVAEAVQGPTVYYHGTKAAGIEVPDIRNERPIFVTTARNVAQQAATQGAAGARMGEVKNYGRGRVLPLEIASGTKIIDETTDIARQIRMIEDSVQIEPDQARLLWMQQNNVAAMRTGSAVRSAEDIRRGVPEQFKLSEHEYAIADPSVLRRSTPRRLPQLAGGARRLATEEAGFARVGRPKSAMMTAKDWAALSTEEKVARVRAAGYADERLAYQQWGKIPKVDRDRIAAPAPPAPEAAPTDLAESTAIARQVLEGEVIIPRRSLQPGEPGYIAPEWLRETTPEAAEEVRPAIEKYRRLKSLRLGEQQGILTPAERNELADAEIWFRNLQASKEAELEADRVVAEREQADYMAGRMAERKEYRAGRQAAAPIEPPFERMAQAPEAGGAPPREPPPVAEAMAEEPAMAQPPRRQRRPRATAQPVAEAMAEEIPPSGAEPPGGIPPVGAEPPSPAERLPTNYFGVRGVSAGLRRSQELLNAARRTLGRPFSMVEDNPIATPLMEERGRVKGDRVESLANAFGHRYSTEAKGVFSLDKTGLRITGLEGVDPTVPGAPTLSDVAARLPRYRDQLTPEQIDFLSRLEAEMAEIHDSLDMVGIEIGSRSDVMEGGFYLPRGRADIEGADLPIKVGAGFGRGGRKGFEKPAVFDSQAAGIEAKLAYSNLSDAFSSYVLDVGNRVVDAHTANAFKMAIDDEGNLLAETAADRINPALRDRVNGLRARIATRYETLTRQETRGRAQTAEAKRRAQDMARIEKRTGSAEWVANEVARAAKGGTLVGNVDVGLAETRKALAILRQESRYVSKRLTEAEKRSGKTLSRYDETQAAIKEFQDELHGIRGEWEKAKRRAALTPREQGMIGLPGLQGYTFPDAIANAANKVLQGEGEPRGVGSSMIRAAMKFNNIYRQFTATLDNSGVGIQGLLSAYADPRNTAKALRVNVQAWGRGGDDALGAYFNDFNRRPDVVGGQALTVQEWARDGAHFGATASEYAFQPLERVPIIQRPIHLANRAYGYFGDTERLSRMHDEFIKEARRTGLSKEQLIENGTTERIAKAINGETGWAKHRTAGDVGELTMYAARYFQSRLETVARGAAGLRPGAPLEQRIARRDLLRMVGWGTLFTVALNAMQGQDTDFRPVIPDPDVPLEFRRNYNFMRVRALGRDWSLFGTWDSLVGAIIQTASGDPAGALRGLGSGVVSLGWDLIGNKDFDGEPVRDDPVQFARWLIESMSPFAWQEAPDIAGRAISGDIPGAAVLATGEMLGAKSSPVTPYERLAELRDSTAKRVLSNPKATWDTITPAQQAKVALDPALQKAETAYKAGRTSEPDVTAMLRQQREAGDAVEAKLPKNIQTEMNRLGVNVSVERSISQGTAKAPTYYLSDQLFARYQERISYHLSGLAATTMASATWRSASDAANEQQLGKLVAEAKRRARIDVLKEAGGGALSQPTTPTAAAPTAETTARPSFQQVRERFSQPLLPVPVMP